MAVFIRCDGSLLHSGKKGTVCVWHDIPIFAQRVQKAFPGISEEAALLWIYIQFNMLYEIMKKYRTNSSEPIAFITGPGLQQYFFPQTFIQMAMFQPHYHADWQMYFNGKRDQGFEPIIRPRLPGESMASDAFQAAYTNTQNVFREIFQEDPPARLFPECSQSDDGGGFFFINNRGRSLS